MAPHSLQRSPFQPRPYVIWARLLWHLEFLQLYHLDIMQYLKMCLYSWDFVLACPYVWNSLSQPIPFLGSFLFLKTLYQVPFMCQFLGIQLAATCNFRPATTATTIQTTLSVPILIVGWLICLSQETEIPWSVSICVQYPHLLEEWIKEAHIFLRSFKMVRDT